jgi:hypothetical protein
MPLTELEMIAFEAMRQSGLHPCKYGHVAWGFIGGANCGCFAEAACSVPVYGCEACGDRDYGNNMEAESQRALCFDMFGPWDEDNVQIEDPVQQLPIHEGARLEVQSFRTTDNGDS